MADKKELLRSMLNNLINDRTEEASMDFHNYLTPKTREVSGLGGQTAYTEDDANDDQE